MAGIKFANNASSLLAASITETSTSVAVTSGEGLLFPILGAGDWFMATLVKLVGALPVYEIVKVTGRSGDVMTMVRAQEGTTALTFAAGAKFDLRMTAGALDSKADRVELDAKADQSDVDLKADLIGPTFTGTTNNGKSTMNGSTTTMAAVLVNAAEKITVSAAAAAGTITYDLTTQSLLYLTLSATGNWTVNLRGNASNTLNSLLAIGEATTATLLATQGATAFIANGFQVDGTAVTPKWLGGAAPVTGNVSGIDAYSFTIVKTANATFTVLASLSQFK
jgi:hypothetical protein